MAEEKKITLMWMNKIRELRSRKLPEQVILDTIFEIGLKEEECINKEFKDGNEGM